MTEAPTGDPLVSSQRPSGLFLTAWCMLAAFGPWFGIVSGRALSGVCDLTLLCHGCC